MADTKISDMTVATDLTGAVVPIVQGGANKKAPIALFEAASGSYLKYVALLTQTGIDAPVANVLENTLGATITYTRGNIGQYLLTSSVVGSFPIEKTFIIIGNGYNQYTHNAAASSEAVDENEIYIESGVGVDFQYDDDQLYYTPIEIRVYP